jgi:hypothetical protein
MTSWEEDGVLQIRVPVVRHILYYNFIDNENNSRLSLLFFQNTKENNANGKMKKKIQ